MCSPAGMMANPKARRKIAEKGFLGIGMKKGYAEYDRFKEKMNPTENKNDSQIKQN